MLCANAPGKQPDSKAVIVPPRLRVRATHCKEGRWVTKVSCECNDAVHLAGSAATTEHEFPLFPTS